MAAMFIVFLAMGCEREAQGCIPSNDPLVTVRFESMLSDAQIDYTRDKKGFYIPTASSDYEELLEICEKALDIEPGRTSTVIQSQCGGDKLRNQLRDQKVYFVHEHLEEKPVITVSKSDAANISLAALYASLELKCHPGMSPSR